MKRLLPFIILLGALVGLVVSIPFVLNPDRHRAEVTEVFSRLVHHPVVIGTISAGYWPPTLRLGTVSVMKEGGVPALEIDSLEGPLDWKALFHLKLAPSALDLKGWRLTIRRDVEGRWDFGEWLAGSSGAGNSSWPLKQIRWKDGSVRWQDPFGSGGPQELMLGSMEGNWEAQTASVATSGTLSGPGSATARLALTAKGRFLSAPEWSGDLQFVDQANACTFHLENHAGTYDLKGGAAAWRLVNALSFLNFYTRGNSVQNAAADALLLDRWQLHIHGGSDGFSFEHSAGISGGQTEASGRTALEGGSTVLHADAALKDIPAEALWSLAAENFPLSGKITAVGKEMEVRLSSNSLSSFQGQGFVIVKDGSYPFPDSTFKKLSKAKSMRYLQKKYPDLVQNGLPISLASAHWAAKKGLVQFDDGVVVSSAGKAGVVGKVDLSRDGIDSYVRVQFHEKSSKLAALLPVRYRSAPAFGRIQGTLHEWLLRSVPAHRIPAAIQSKLRKAVR